MPLKIWLPFSQFTNLRTKFNYCHLGPHTQKRHLVFNLKIRPTPMLWDDTIWLIRISTPDSPSTPLICESNLRQSAVNFTFEKSLESINSSQSPLHHLRLFIISECYKLPHAWWLKTTQLYDLKTLVVRSLKSRCSRDWLLLQGLMGRICFLAFFFSFWRLPAVFGRGPFPVFLQPLAFYHATDCEPPVSFLQGSHWAHLDKLPRLRSLAFSLLPHNQGR